MESAQQIEAITAGSRFEVLSRIGHGSSCAVYLARPCFSFLDNKPVVLKAFTVSDPSAMSSAQREVHFLELCRSRYVVEFYGSVFEGEALYLVLENAPGGHMLDTWLSPMCRQSFRFYLKVCDELLSALSHVHKRGVLHRNIKMDNVLLSAKGTVRLSGFSRAALYNEAASQTGWWRVDESFAETAPETLSGGLYDVRSEIYAAGALLYELLCGRSPFFGLSQADRFKAKFAGDIDSPCVHVPELPDGLGSVIMKALEMNSEARYRSMTEFRAALYAWYEMMGRSADRAAECGRFAA